MNALFFFHFSSSFALSSLKKGALDWLVSISSLLVITIKIKEWHQGTADCKWLQRKQGV